MRGRAEGGGDGGDCPSFDPASSEWVGLLARDDEKLLELLGPVSSYLCRVSEW